MIFENSAVSVTDKIIFIDGVPKCFVDLAASQEHMNSWIDTPLDVNVEADAFAGDDGDDHSADATINYGCVAW